METKVNYCQKNQGFTLVEVAIVMLIGGLLVAAASAALSVYIKQTRLKVTNERLDAINGALQTFLNQNGVYPCPASFTAPIDDPLGNFGTAVANCAAVAPGGADDTVRTPGRNNPAPTRNVRIGSVPVRTLNLPDDYISDAWGARFTYAVTERLTDSGTYNVDEGGIRVIDRNNNDVIVSPAAGSGHYVVVSHGQNRSGSVPTGGGAGVPVCPAGPSDFDAENCDRDATFRSTLLISEGTDRFDDILRARSISPFGAAVPSNAVMAFNQTNCPPGWSDFAAADGNTVIGFVAGGGTVLGAAAGNNNHTLTLGQAGSVVSGTGINPAVLIATAAGGVTFLRPLNGSGTGTTYDTRQGYVALKYCVKN